MTTERELRARIENEIKRFVREDPGNRFERLDNSPMFLEPLVGFAAGDDPIFKELKKIIGQFHLTPLEVMADIARSRGIPVPAEDSIGVVCYVLPISSPTKKENAGMKDGPSERWANVRLFGESFNRSVQRNMISLLQDKGFVAGSPDTQKGLYQLHTDEKVGFTSNWSLRHIAFAAGLGSFGLCDGLITKEGKAHRIGSFVVDRRFRSPKRTGDLHENCLFFHGKACRECMKRCPVGAISEKGHDKSKCKEFVFGQQSKVLEKYGIDIYACGLCQTGVPCESGIPRKVKK